MEQFFSDEDLVDLLDELERDEAEIEELEYEMEEEMNASNRRFEQIIKKHQME